MKAKELILAAYELIKDEDHWCTRDYAQDETGNRVDLSSENASKFCAVGALGRVERAERGCYLRFSGKSEFAKAYRILLDCCVDGETVESTNDCKGHEAILGVFLRAMGDN